MKIIYYLIAFFRVVLIVFIVAPWYFVFTGEKYIVK